MGHEKQSAIYMYENIYNHKIYVGQAQDVYVRKKAHKNCLASGKDSPYFQNAWDKYGEHIFRFEILRFCLPEELNDLEKMYIRELHSHVTEWGYNISWGKDASGLYGIKAGEETKNKLSKLHIGLKERNNTYSKYVGITYYKKNNKWAAKIVINRKRYWLGMYTTETEAALAYNNAALEFIGKDANINIIPQEDIAAIPPVKTPELLYRREIREKNKEDNKVKTNNQLKPKKEMKKRILTPEALVSVREKRNDWWNSKSNEEKDIFSNRVSEITRCKKQNKVSSSKYIGVYFSKHAGLYVSTLRYNSKNISLGYFLYELEAALAYNEAALYFYGYKAKLNQISDEEIIELWNKE